MMERLGTLVKLLAAIALVTGLLLVGAVVFVLLLGVAAVISLVLWVKRRQKAQPQQVWDGGAEQPYAPYPSVTIIEGEAEEVYARQDTLPSGV